MMTQVRTSTPSWTDHVHAHVHAHHARVRGRTEGQTNNPTARRGQGQEEKGESGKESGKVLVYIHCVQTVQQHDHRQTTRTAESAYYYCKVRQHVAGDNFGRTAGLDLELLLCLLMGWHSTIEVGTARPRRRTDAQQSQAAPAPAEARW